MADVPKAPSNSCIVGNEQKRHLHLDTLQGYEQSSYLPRSPAALTSKMKALEASLNASGIFFRIGKAAIEGKVK